MQSRFHVYQQPPLRPNIEPRLSGAALDDQYEELLPTLRRYCSTRQFDVVVMAETTDPEVPGRVLTLTGSAFKQDQAEALMDEFLQYLNKLVPYLHLIADQLK